MEIPGVRVRVDAILIFCSERVGAEEPLDRLGVLPVDALEVVGERA